jgi:hypothetical protein
MKLTATCTRPDGGSVQVVIDLCAGCTISVDPPAPPGRSFSFDAPGGEASGDNYAVSSELRDLLHYNISPGELTAVGPIPYVPGLTYGWVDPAFLVFPDNCAPGEFPATELYSNDNWHTTAVFAQHTSGRIFLLPAYGAVNLPLDTTRISLGLPVCTLPV